MKKCLTLLLALALCMGLTVPALAAYPETQEEAMKNFSVNTSLNEAGYQTWKNETYSLYTQEYNYDRDAFDEPHLISDYPEQNGYHAIGRDTTLTVTNTGTTDDFYIWLHTTVFIKDEQGRYVTRDGGERTFSLRQGGFFESTALSADSDMEENALLTLTQGESATVTGAQLVKFDDAEDAIVRLSINLQYPEQEKRWVFQGHYRVSDTTANPNETNLWYSMATDLDKYNNVVNEEFSLQDEMGALTAPNYSIVADDTSYSIYNTSGTLDNYMVLLVTSYVKSGDSYVADTIYFKGKDGWIDYDNATEDGELFYMVAGAGCFFNSLPGYDGEQDMAYGFTLLQFSLAGEALNSANRLFLVDNEKAAELKSNPFTDVPAGAYYHDAVLWALEKGITTGMTETTFGPAATCTRGQVATFLWRAKGSPEPAAKTNPFTDVKESDYFYKAVLWAYEKGITTGTTATAFSPEATCTSGQVITFLWRANDKPAAETEGTEYYAQAVAWANANGLLAGTDVPFAPENQSPRADIVTYLYRDLAE